MTDQDDALEQLRAQLLERIKDAATTAAMGDAIESVIDERGEVLGDLVRKLAHDEAEVVAVDQAAGGAGHLELFGRHPTRSGGTGHLELGDDTVRMTDEVHVTIAPATVAVTVAIPPVGDVAAHAAQGVVTFTSPEGLRFAAFFVTSFEQFVQSVLEGDPRDVAAAGVITLAVLAWLFGARLVPRERSKDSD